jgi:hypothetical protein
VVFFVCCHTCYHVLFILSFNNVYNCFKRRTRKIMLKTNLSLLWIRSHMVLRNALCLIWISRIVFRNVLSVI